MQPLVLTEEQEHDVQQIITEPTNAALIASEMGTGKTVVACEVMIRLGMPQNLIICPIGVRVNFERTLRRQGYTGDLRRIDGTKKGKQAFDDLKNGVDGTYIIGRELFRQRDWFKIKPDVVVFDEMHVVSNRKSLGFRQLKALKPKRLRLGMSGTPSGNKFEGMWAVTRWLWPDIVDNSFWRWAADYTQSVFDYKAGREKIVGELEAGKYVNTLPCYIRRESSLDVEYIEEIRYVELTPTQRKLYSQMEEEAIMWLEENPSVASVPIVQRIRLRQVTLGVPTLENGEVTFAPNCTSSKIDALKEIIKDLDDDEPVLILTDSKHFARVVAHRLGDKAALWSGDETHAARDRTKEKFLSGSVQWLVATIPSIAEGVDLLQTRCNHVVWLSRSENRMLNEQAQGRLHRTGQQKHVYSFDIRATDTYDDNIFQRLELQALEMSDSLKKEVA